MAQFTLRTWPTTSGDVATYRPASQEKGERAVVVFLHGALRRSELLFPWADRLANLADTFFIDLPGHGRSATCDATTIDRMGCVLREVISPALAGRRCLLVGESLGGAVALAIAGAGAPEPLRGVFAADPPMTTAKLWNLAQAMRSAAAVSGAPAFVAALARDSFGVTPTSIEERIYYPLVGGLTVPAVIATGDVPLLPPRRTAGIACLFDNVDRFVVEQLYPGKARLMQFAKCGHVVLNDAADDCRGVIETMLAELA